VSRAKDKRRYTKDKRPEGGFVAMPHVVLRSQQFAALSSHGVKLLLDLLSEYNGGNNGDLAATWNLMRKRGWRSRDTLWKALRELLDAGWIAQTRQGGLHIPSLYGVTIFALDESSKLDVRAAGFPRGAWARGSASKNESSNTPTVSIPRESTRPPCQLSVSEQSIDTPSERVKHISGSPLTRPARASIDLPYLCRDDTPPPSLAPHAPDPDAGGVFVRAARSRALRAVIAAPIPAPCSIGPEFERARARRANADARVARRKARTTTASASRCAKGK